MFINGLSDLTLISNAESRSITPENPKGLPGMGGACELKDGIAGECARELGKGWKVNPSVRMEAGQVLEIVDIKGEGVVQHIWMTPTGKWRDVILRIYWDGQEWPSVECPVGDFFASGWESYARLQSMAVCVNPGSAFNCYWQMPFRKQCRITLENRAEAPVIYYYQIDYTFMKVPEASAYFHARFRRCNPLPYKEVYTILDGVQGQGTYVGTYVAWGSNNNDWWGEGEVKFYIDDDGEYPTICGTGTEDYFCGSYNFENQTTHTYEAFSSPYSGFHQVIRPDGVYMSQMRFGMYRWHIMDPIRFKKRLKVTMQALGWRRASNRYLPLQDDIASVAYWYQTLPSVPFEALQDKDYLEVI